MGSGRRVALIDGPSGSGGSSLRIAARHRPRSTSSHHRRAAPGISGSAATQGAGDAGQIDVPPGVTPQGMVPVRMVLARPALVGGRADTAIHDHGVGHGPCFPDGRHFIGVGEFGTQERDCRPDPLMVADDHAPLLEECVTARPGGSVPPGGAERQLTSSTQTVIRDTTAARDATAARMK